LPAASLAARHWLRVIGYASLACGVNDQ